MGLTEKGYVRKTYDEILNGKIAKAKELFGEDIDTSDQGPLGKYIRINAYDQAVLEEQLEAVYFSRFPNTATGQSLDRLLIFGGLTRNTATAAEYRVRIYGTADAVVPMGFLVGTDTGLTFYTKEDATIGASGTCTVDAICTEPGTMGNVASSSINVIVNPDANVEAVTGIKCLSPGADAESDADLRVRFKAALAGGGSCNKDAVRAAILRVPGVQYAAVVVNDTNEPDSDGRPPHSFECFVKGGDDYAQEIAHAIYSKRPLGITTVGDITVAIKDISGDTQEVRYSTVPDIGIIIRVQMETNSLFPSDGWERLEAKIADHINKLGIGTSLVLSTLYGTIYSVPGVVEVKLLMASTDGGETFSAENVTMPKHGTAACDGVEFLGIVIKKQPTDVVAAVGETVILSVEAAGAVSYRWYNSNDNVTWNKSSLEGYNTPTLTFEMNESRYNYQWRCVLTDAAGHEVATDAVWILRPDE